MLQVLRKSLPWARKILFYLAVVAFVDGNAGGKIIVPTSAIRDEGTSYHYLPPQEEIWCGKKENEVLVSCLERLSYPYIKVRCGQPTPSTGKRKKAIHLRKNQGCLGVEMECASMLAVANFRNVSLLSFFLWC